MAPADAAHLHTPLPAPPEVGQHALVMRPSASACSCTSCACREGGVCTDREKKALLPLKLLCSLSL